MNDTALVHAEDSRQAQTEVGGDKAAPEEAALASRCSLALAKIVSPDAGGAEARSGARGAGMTRASWNSRMSCSSAG